jgi:TM2 domain-containing membrane protein YozV
LKYVTGAVGKGVSEGKDKIFVWDAVKEVGYVDVDAAVIKIESVAVVEREEAMVSQQDGVGKGDYQQQNIPSLNSGYSPKKPGLSWLLSFLVPGVGQFYNGDVGKGIGFVVADVVGYSVMVAGMLQTSTVTSGYSIYGYTYETVANPNMGMILGGVAIMFGTWTWAQIDAPISAVKKNRAHGYGYLLDLGKDRYLTLEPDLKTIPVMSSTTVEMKATYGVGLKLRF